MTIFLFLSSNNDDNFFFLSLFINNDNFLDMIQFLVRKKILQVMHNFFLFQEIPPPPQKVLKCLFHQCIM